MYSEIRSFMDLDRPITNYYSAPGTTSHTGTADKESRSSSDTEADFTGVVNIQVSWTHQSVCSWQYIGLPVGVCLYILPEAERLVDIQVLSFEGSKSEFSLLAWEFFAAISWHRPRPRYDLCLLNFFVYSRTCIYWPYHTTTETAEKQYSSIHITSTSHRCNKVFNYIVWVTIFSTICFRTIIVVSVVVVFGSQIPSSIILR